MSFNRYVVMLMLTLLLFGCNSQKDVPTVRVGHALHDHHAPLFIAAEKGIYFNSLCGVYLKKISYKDSYDLYENGNLIAHVKLDSSTGGILLIRKLDEGILDLTFGGVPAMISMIDKGSNIRIIAPVMSEGAGFVVRKDMPVSNWEEFVNYAKKSKKPVRIGYKVDVSVQNLIFESALAEEGLTFSRNISDTDVNVIVINLHGPSNLLPSLHAGVIDGFVVMQPFPALAENSGEAKMISTLSALPPDGKWSQHPCCALAAGDDFITKNENVVKALVKLFASANDFIRVNHDESAQIVSDWLATPLAVEERSLPTITYMNRYTDAWEQGITFWISSMIDKGALTGKIKKAYEQGNVTETLYDNRVYDSLRAK